MSKKTKRERTADTCELVVADGSLKTGKSEVGKGKKRKTQTLVSSLLSRVTMCGWTLPPAARLVWPLGALSKKQNWGRP